ncbi:PulJ/GspJ family protein, partial [Legionella tunisiensis]|uniref:PulJ/GspJ family protein n=1 Tax=Legionella tunisiensis TaxID=1034944 RepID=UPI000376FD71
MKCERGFGLTEVIITVFLASLIIIVLLQHYLNCKRFYLDAEITLEREFELQLVSDLIRDSVRRAGFTPCININHLQSIDRRSNKRIYLLLKQMLVKPCFAFNRMSEYLPQ